MKSALKRIVNSPNFNIIILILVFVNSILIGLQTTSLSESNQFLQNADRIFLCIFSIEIVLKIIANGKFFFYDKWSVFDAIIIICSVLFAMSSLMVFRVFGIFKSLKSVRILRYLRIMRFFPNSQNLQKIIASISRSIPKILSTGFLLIFVFYIYAILGVSLYSTPSNSVCGTFFGSIITTLKTLFQIMTGDSWASVIARNVQVFHPSIWFYLISFYIITALTLLSVITGVIVDSISNVSKEFEKGMSRYTKENHILILGFNEIALYILEQINSYEIDSKNILKRKILVLDNGDSDKHRLELAEKLGDENCLNVEFFRGELDEERNLEKCNVAHAKSILLLGNDETKIPKTILIIRSLWEKKSQNEGSTPYLATVVNSENLCQSLRRAFPPKTNEHIHILSGEKIISNILAHSCRKSGFSEIFKELLTPDKNEIYVKAFPKRLNEKTFYEVALSYPKSTLIGFIDSNGKAFLNPQNKKQKMGKNFKGVFLSETEKTINYSKNEKSVDLQKLDFVSTKNILFGDKHILFIGCNKYLQNILLELDNYVGKGSSAVIVANNDERKIFQTEIEALPTKNFTCTFDKNLNLQNFSNIPEKIEVIVFLANSTQESNEADSEVFMHLLTLLSGLQQNEQTENAPPKFRLLCEMRKIENQSIAPKEDKLLSLNGLEYVVGNRLTSQLLAQIALNENIHKIYEELLSSDGSEIYMRSPSEYGFESTEYSICDITEKVLATNEIFIGYTNSNGDVVLNPAKNEKNLQIENLIVLSEG